MSAEAALSQSTAARADSENPEAANYCSRGGALAPERGDVVLGEDAALHGLRGRRSRRARPGRRARGPGARRRAAAAGRGRCWTLPESGHGSGAHPTARFSSTTSRSRVTMQRARRARRRLLCRGRRLLERQLRETATGSTVRASKTATSFRWASTGDDLRGQALVNSVVENQRRERPIRIGEVVRRFTDLLPDTRSPGSASSRTKVWWSWSGPGAAIASSTNTAKT